MATNQPTPVWKESLRDILAGTFAGILGRFLEYPFDTVKVKLQAASLGNSSMYRGPMDCFFKTLHKEGVVGLYRGMSMPLAATVIETSTLFFTNGYLKRQLSEAGHIKPGDELPMSMVLLAGAGTGFIVSFVLTPIELVKCRLQVAHDMPSSANGVVKYSGPTDCLVKSVKSEGLKVVYRGHLATMLREVPGTACWFGAYESFVRWMTPPNATREDVSSSVIIAAGALGGMAYWGVMYPCDTVKSAMQIAESPMVVEPAATSTTSATSTLGSLKPSVPVAKNVMASYAASASGIAKHAATAMRAGVRTFTTAVPAPLSEIHPDSFRKTFMAIYRSSGVRGLYAGFLPTIVRAAPSNAAIFVGYEWANSQMKTLF